MDFNEKFLSFIWQYSLFNTFRLFCADGKRLQILHPGTLNKNSGPDFIGAKLIIDQTTWVGHVEIHLKSSDWLLHNHHHDSFYDSVILHVVYSHDSAVFRTNGSRLPVLVLKDIFSNQLLINYREIISSTNTFPCQRHIAGLDKYVIEAFLSRLVIERFEQKSIEVIHKLEDCRGDWEQTYYYFMARSFGFKVNALPFELLADALPHQICAKHKDNALQIAALIFGQAGFLDQQFFEKYPKQLQTEYTFLKRKYSLISIDRILWKFLRMRPQNFPTVRLAQFAALVLKSRHTFSNILSSTSTSEIYSLFNNLQLNEYWQTHYHFNKESSPVENKLGLRSVHSIIINSVCLLLCAYGRYTDQPHFVERAMELLEKLPAENNAIVNHYVCAGIKVDSAFKSQALLQLNKYYCSQKKCLNCGIGIKILKK